MTGSVIAHEIGHNFGLFHTGTHTDFCLKEFCLTFCALLNENKL